MSLKDAKKVHYSQFIKTIRIKNHVYKKTLGSLKHICKLLAVTDFQYNSSTFLPLPKYKEVRNSEEGIQLRRDCIKI